MQQHMYSRSVMSIVPVNTTMKVELGNCILWLIQLGVKASFMHNHTLMETEHCTNERVPGYPDHSVDQYRSK